MTFMRRVPNSYSSESTSLESPPNHQSLRCLAYHVKVNQKFVRQLATSRDPYLSVNKFTIY